MNRSHLFLSMVVVAGIVFASGSALAQRDRTEQAFDRFEEALEPQVDEGTLSPQGIGPILLVGATPAFEETRAWFPVAALESLTRLFGPSNVRMCESCLNPRVDVQEGRLEYSTALTVPEIIALDGGLRGKGAPARSAIWMEETPGGMAVRIVSLSNGTVLYAANFDGKLREQTRTAELYTYTLELGRRLRGESLTHIFFDAGVLPNQHFAVEVAEQFGPDNLNLAGITFSATDPVFGIGFTYYRVIPLLFNFTIGAQAIVSVPTAVITIFSNANNTPIDPNQLIDPIATGVLVARFPIPSTNFAIYGSASTNLAFTVGISLLNFSFLPIVP